LAAPVGRRGCALDRIVSGRTRFASPALAWIRSRNECLECVFRDRPTRKVGRHGQNTLWSGPPGPRGLAMRPGDAPRRAVDPGRQQVADFRRPGRPRPKSRTPASGRTRSPRTSTRRSGSSSR
jgi:hypothetical protein